MASTLTEAQLAKLAKLAHLKSLAARTKTVTDNLQTQINNLGNDAIKTVKVNGTSLTPAENGVDILIGCEKQATAETGYASTYVIKANGVQVGDKINVAKDWVLSDVAKGNVTAEDKAAGGKFENDSDFAVGDRYVDMEFNVKAGGAETSTHIYLNVQEFIDLYTPGNGLQEANAGEFSVKISSSSANGLSVDANGIALGLAQAAGDGVLAKNGAMSGADKGKLDGISAQANKTTVTTEGSGVIEIDGTSKTIVEIAADADVTTMLNEELPAPSDGE